MTRNCHVPFWRAVEEATPSLTLIILKLALKEWANTVGRTELEVSGEIPLCLEVETPPSKGTRRKRKA